MPLDIALQQAKLEIIRTNGGGYQLPYFWAAGILVGKTVAIALQQPFAWQYVFAGLAVAAFALLPIKKEGVLSQFRI